MVVHGTPTSSGGARGDELDGGATRVVVTRPRPRASRVVPALGVRMLQQQGKPISPRATQSPLEAMDGLHSVCCSGAPPPPVLLHRSPGTRHLVGAPQAVFAESLLTLFVALIARPPRAQTFPHPRLSSSFFIDTPLPSSSPQHHFQTDD